MMGGASFGACLAEAHWSSGVLEPTLGSLHKLIFARSVAIAHAVLDQNARVASTLNLRSLRRHMIVGGHSGDAMHKQSQINPPQGPILLGLTARERRGSTGRRGHSSKSIAKLLVISRKDSGRAPTERHA
jgi:hypothetical protein